MSLLSSSSLLMQFQSFIFAKCFIFDDDDVVVAAVGVGDVVCRL